MAAALPFIQIAGAVISAIGAIQQGQAAKASSDFNATVSQQNAQIARQNAADQAAQADRESYLRLGAIRAAAGASGGASGEGSVLDVLADSASQSELEKQNIIYRGELQARGYTNTAMLDTYSGNQAKSGSYLKAGAELLSGGANAAKSYSQLNTPKRT
jgi:hypothetical protein